MSNYHHHPQGIGVEDLRCVVCGKRHSRAGHRASGSASSLPARSPPRGGVVSPRNRAVFSIAVLLVAASLPVAEGRSAIVIVGGGAFATVAATTANEERVGLGLTTRHLQQDVAANETAAEAEHEDEEHEEHTEEEAGHEDHKEEGHEDHDGMAITAKSWGQVIVATLLVNLATLVGVFVLLTNYIRGRCVKRGIIGESVGKGILFEVLVLSFAAGALLATAVFLILPEGLEMIGGGHEGTTTDSEATISAKFGCAFLGGFFLPLVFAIFFHIDAKIPGGAANLNGYTEPVDTGVAVGEPSYSSVVEHIEEDKDAKEQIVSGLSNQELEKIKPVIDKQLVASILLGDAFHNLADGILIAASFVSCNISLAISIAAITIVHELAQEIGDFILLTKLAGLSICKALILNFISGMTVVLGGVIFLLAQPTDQATGIMLTIGAGVYVNIAATETMPRLKEIVRTRMDRIWSLIGCIIGTIPIGLVLLNHHHCEE